MQVVEIDQQQLWLCMLPEKELAGYTDNDFDKVMESGNLRAVRD